MRKEAIVTYPKVLFRYPPGQIEENHGNFQPR